MDIVTLSAEHPLSKKIKIKMEREVVMPRRTLHKLKFILVSVREKPTQMAWAGF